VASLLALLISCNGGNAGTDADVVDDRCPGGLSYCAGACLDTSSDHSNCGSCGNECEAAQVCNEGECLLECPADKEECEGGCIDVDSDPMHCGDCDRVCEAGDHARAVCIGGVCGMRCDPGWSDMDGDGSCETPCEPTSDVELCNGIDDNCDGNIDEGFEMYRCPLTGAILETELNCDANCNVSEACDVSAVAISGAMGALADRDCCSHDYHALQFSGSGDRLEVTLDRACTSRGYYGSCETGEIDRLTGSMTFGGTTVRGSAGVLTDPTCSSIWIRSVLFEGSGDALGITTSYRCSGSDKSRTDTITFEGARITGSAGTIVDEECCDITFGGLQLSGTAGDLQIATDYFCRGFDYEYNCTLSGSFKRKVETLMFEGDDFSWPMGNSRASALRHRASRPRTACPSSPASEAGGVPATARPGKP